MAERDLNETAEIPKLSIAPTTTSMVRLMVAAGTHAGHVRSTNEDQFLAARLSRALVTLASSLPAEEAPLVDEREAFILAVADGVGGHAAGERASRLVIGEGIRSILHAANWTLLLDNGESERLRARLVGYFDSMNAALRRAVESDPELEGMATTLSVVYTVGPRAFVIHVGDSRVYRLRDGALEQLTRDHTVAQQLVDVGAIGSEQVRDHPRKHVLTNVMAGRDDLGAPDVTEHDLRDGDVLLVCSDGLSDSIPASELTNLLLTHVDLNEAVAALIAAALAAGGRDNVTAVVARCVA